MHTECVSRSIFCPVYLKVSYCFKSVSHDMRRPNSCWSSFWQHRPALNVLNESCRLVDIGASAPSAAWALRSCVEHCSQGLWTRAETNTSSTRLPGSLNYPNYPIASIRIRESIIFALQQARTKIDLFRLLAAWASWHLIVFENSSCHCWYRSNLV